MAMYHINDEGEVGTCTAKIKCAFGENAFHTEDREEADLRSEQILAEKFEATKPRSKYQKTTKKLDINESFPPPEASSLEKIDSLALALNDDTTITPIHIKRMIGVDTQRVGSYYGDAMGYLGLLEVDKSSGLKAYKLTEAGREYVNASPRDRHAMLKEAILNTDIAKNIRNIGDDQSSRKLSVKVAGTEITADKKVKCVKSWINQLSENESIKTRDRSKLAEKLQRVSADDYVDSDVSETRKEEVKQNLCSNCFMLMPLTNVCPNCD